MKTISTTNSSAATQLPNQAAPVRVRGTGLLGDATAGPAGLGGGTAAGSSAGAFRV
jgi:hypothetical protein